MDFKYIYSDEEIAPDTLSDIAGAFFDIRDEKNLSLDEVSKGTGLSVLEIDALETTRTTIDLRNVVILLDFYEKKLEAYDFRDLQGLDPEMYQKYFSN